MTGMKQEFGYFLKNAKFRAALGLTLLLSYGYAIATTRVSIDSLEGDRYIGTGGVMLSTGRFGMNLWAAVLGYGRAEPSYAVGIDLLAALLLGLVKLEDVKEVGLFLTGIFPLLFVPAAAGVMELWVEMGDMLLPIVIAIVPVTVLVLVTAGHTTQALTRRKQTKKEAAANDSAAE